jgi:DNA-3-methyladenine glycosylase
LRARAVCITEVVVPKLLRLSEIRHTDSVSIARSLLGKILVTRLRDDDRDGRDDDNDSNGDSRGGATTRFARRITEVEAYDGPHDLACHASRGRTKRTEPLFAAGGVWYIYFIYGMHEMLNLVTGPRDHPAAVLIRGVEGIVGPGRVTRAFHIDRRFNALPATRATGLWIEDDGFEVDPALVRATPRIGIDFAGPEWAAKPWRFVMAIPTATQTRGARATRRPA